MGSQLFRRKLRRGADFDCATVYLAADNAGPGTACAARAILPRHECRGLARYVVTTSSMKADGFHGQGGVS